TRAKSPPTQFRVPADPGRSPARPRDPDAERDSLPTRPEPRPGSPGNLSRLEGDSVPGRRSCRFVQMRKMTAIRGCGGGCRLAIGPVPHSPGRSSRPHRSSRWPTQRRASCVLRAPLGTSARAIGLCGVAALAISPLALTLPAQAAAPVTGATTAAPSAAAHGGRPDPTYTPADRREAIAEAKQDRAAMADKLRLGAKEALVVKDVLRDTDGTEHIPYNRNT